MDEFLNVLDTDPQRLREYKARPETWRGFVPAQHVEKRKVPSIVLQRLGIRRPLPPTPPPAVTVSAGGPLKLYHPAHQRHYLVACSLVCETIGLPDRALESGMGDQPGFVIRRLLPVEGTATWQEYAWVPGQQTPVWQKIGPDPRRLFDGEERLPLFAVHFAENDQRRRRLFGGVIPIGKREQYLGAPKSSGNPTPGITPRTSRKILLRKEVIEPWKSLVQRAQLVGKSFTAQEAKDKPTEPQKAARLKVEREQIQAASWFILLDFAKYLATYLKPVWRAVLKPELRDGLRTPEKAVFDVLVAAGLSLTLRRRLRGKVTARVEGIPTGVDELGEIHEIADQQDGLYSIDDVLPTLRHALSRYGAGAEGLNNIEQDLEGIDIPYDRYFKAKPRKTSPIFPPWPAFLFPLADPDLSFDLTGVRARARFGEIDPLNLAKLSPEEQADLTADEDDKPTIDPLKRLDKLAVLIVRALREDDQPAPEPAVPAAALPPANALEGWFVIRCVFERPQCAPLPHSEVISDPTELFQMAGFFDPDAPARPIRIGLPIDTSPGGLRKFDKNTAFVISDTLCGQLSRLKGLTLGDLVLSVLPWPFHKDLPSFDGAGEPCKKETDPTISLGMICSLSIPIVTICALILLIIMVSILDYFFKWLPYFIFCFPLPGLKAKPKFPPDQPPPPPFP